MLERRRLNLAKNGLGKPIPIGRVLTLSVKAWIADILLRVFYFVFCPVGHVELR